MFRLGIVVVALTIAQSLIAIPLFDRCGSVMGALAQGRLTFHKESDRQAIESQTQLDLKLGDLLFPIVDRTQTEAGRVRMQQLMGAPFQKVSVIEGRQRAAKELAGNQNLRRLVNRSLSRLGGAADRKSLDHLIEDQPLFNRGDQVRAIGFKAAGYGLIPMTTLTITSALGMPWLSVAPGAVAMASRAPSLYRKRLQLRRFRRLLNESQKISKALMDAESPELQRIGEELARTLKDESYQGGLGNTTRLLDEVNHPLVTLVPDLLFGYSAYKMQNQSREVRAVRDRLAHVMSAIGDLDVLNSFAQMSQDPRFVFPEFEDSRQPYIRVEQGHHPYVIAANPRASVPNDVVLGSKGRDKAPSFLMVTGGNGEGKSSYLTMVALNSVLGQMGGPVAARSMQYTPVQPVTYKAPPDSMVDGRSSFQSESTRAADVVKLSTKGKRMLGLLDQMLDGTNPGQKLAGEAAIVRHLAKTGQLFVLATHDLPISALAETTAGVGNAHMRNYRLGDGVIVEGNAFDVMEAMGMPAEVVQDARRIYQAHEQGQSLKEATEE